MVIDRDGVIRAKLLFDGYQRRHNAKEIIEAAKGIE